MAISLLVTMPKTKWALFDWAVCQPCTHVSSLCHLPQNGTLHLDWEHTEAVFRPPGIWFCCAYTKMPTVHSRGQCQCLASAVLSTFSKDKSLFSSISKQSNLITTDSVHFMFIGIKITTINMSMYKWYYHWGLDRTLADLKTHHGVIHSCR